MRRIQHSLCAMLAGTLIGAGAGQDLAPPEPEAAPGPGPAAGPTQLVPSTPVPVPALIPAEAETPAPATIAAPTPSSGFLPPEQPPYGRWIEPTPAQNLAMLEARQSILANDPRAASAAVLLTQLTARYVEDAPRIAELTVRVVRQLRDANQAASPFEMMVGATRWQGPPGPRGRVPRRFEQFARLYRKWRLEEKKDHATTISLMQPPGLPGAAELAPIPAPAP